MEVHPAAAEGFDAGAASYQAARPGYPEGAFARIVGSFPSGTGAVADLAAGTGKFTAGLVARVGRVVAGEPVPGMRDELRRLLPDVEVVACVAERTPFGDGSLRAVTVAQAFHWFDRDRISHEFARILARGGIVAVIANARDERTSWVARLADITGTWDSALKIPKSGDRHWAGIAADPRFEMMDTFTIDHVQPLTTDLFVERVASTSWIARLPETDKRRVLDEVRRMLVDDADLSGRETILFPYRCEAAILRRC